MSRKTTITLGLKKPVIAMLDEMASASDLSRPDVIEQMILTGYKRFQRRRAVADIIDRDMGINKREDAQ
jgi:ABC-type iron transport system FetAB ATPase subunit